MAITKRMRDFGVTYQVKVRGSDSKWISKVFLNKKDAENFELGLKRQKSSGCAVSNNANQITMDEYFTQWFETIHHQATAGWRKLQSAMYRDYVQPVLGRKKLGQITPPLIAKVIGEMAKLGRSEQMKLHVYGLMRKMFSDAIELFEIIPRNPVIKKLRPKVPLKEAKYLNVEQVKKLLTHATGRPYEVAVWLAIYLGLRVGEIQALRWEDIDLEHGILHIRRTYSKHEFVFRDYPKGKKQHSHRIPFELLSLLTRAREDGKRELVIVTPGYKMLDYWKYRDALAEYCKEVGIPVVATHGLRHSTSELYMANGATRDDLKLLFAHSSNSTTDRYVHDKGTRLEKVANVIRLFPDVPQMFPTDQNDKMNHKKEVS